MAEKDKGKKEPAFGDVLLGLVIIFGVVAGVSYFGNYLWIAKAVLKAVLVVGVGGWLLSQLTNLILASGVEIDEMHFAVRSRLKRRISGKKNILYEGIHFFLPYVNTVKEFSMELKTVPIEIKALSKDNLWLSLKGMFEYRADPEVIGKFGFDKDQNVFNTISDVSITQGVVAMVQSALRAVVGLITSDEFKKNGPALKDYLNQMLRKAVPLHRRHNKTTCPVPGCGFDKVITAKDIPRFYNAHSEVSKAELDGEKEDREDYSPVETHYGIDFEIFTIAEVDYTEEAKQALAQKAQVEARAKTNKKRLDVAKELRDELNLSGERALDEADVALNPEIAKQKQLKRISVDKDTAKPVIILSDKP